jgi:hypothetical protein
MAQKDKDIELKIVGTMDYGDETPSPQRRESFGLVDPEPYE